MDTKSCSERRKILFYSNYGCFNMPYEGFMKIYLRFPEKREKYNWDELLDAELANGMQPIYHFVRYDQDVNEYMVSEGLEKFGKYLRMRDIPKCCEYRITEYDGWERVEVVIPYKDIIKDLLNYAVKKETFEFSSGITKELLFGKGIAFLSDLMSYP